MLSLVTISPVITAFHSCCLSHHVFDQVNLWPAWVGIETAIFWQCSPGTIETQRLYLLHLWGPNYWGYGYKTQYSYPRLQLITWKPEVKFSQNVVKKKQHKNYQDHHTLQHIQVHFGVDFQADFEDVRWHDVALTWNHTKDHNRSLKLCFHHPGHVPVIRGNPDLHFERAGNGPVVITWIGREHELYSAASPISLVEHCVTFRHDRRLLSLLGFVHNWPTSRWSATKKENQFSLNGNGIMSSFLGWQFYCSTLYFALKLLSYSRDCHIQSQKDSFSLNLPHTGINIFYWLNTVLEKTNNPEKNRTIFYYCH